MIIIDATNTILGRLATRVSKLALEGESIRITNCEKAFIVGSQGDIIKKYTLRDNLGSKPPKGPFIPKMPDRMVRRTIKGMLPSNERGRKALSNVKCYIGVPEELKDKEAIIIQEASIENLKVPNKLRIDKLCEYLGWQKPK